ncbi:hypothetical protein M2189_004879 [Bradyrhizobium japonicum]|uniref:CoA transferase n=1 Tax=Bradyrhizobium japonicum TaxID=375 RepID=UPI002168E86B|nr:CoA transferase [Bradyrhizobium japonicum]MCS3496162.1 hypothetical protein [Bradyrhizobium japonicum]MCS3961676.1 hypothetical protein [Bradyrhizobium japonicum]MCS3993993.1 hypothetical protein [Bradyrhizobium japonicum]
MNSNLPNELFNYRPSSSGPSVLDTASFIGCPTATMVLSDFATAVVEVEVPETGDPRRHNHLSLRNPDTVRDRSIDRDRKRRTPRHLDLLMKQQRCRRFRYTVPRGAMIVAKKHGRNAACSSERLKTLHFRGMTKICMMRRGHKRGVPR